MFRIQGKVTFQALGTGFWGIVASDGSKYRPDKMPKALQQEGLEVDIEAEDAPNQVSLFMWGRSVHIKKYRIVSNG